VLSLSNVFVCFFFALDKSLYLPDAVRQTGRVVDSPLRPISRDVSSRISHFPSQVIYIAITVYRFIPCKLSFLFYAFEKIG